jgi:2-C-methyl-D-erythritol 4-phosphate cytidylyltransferase
MPEFAVILPAAGSSSRFGGGRNKLFAELGGRAVVLRTLDAFLNRADVRLVVMSATLRDGRWAEAPPAVQQALPHEKLRLCQGGANRAESVRNALAMIPQEIEWVAVHDAARPLVSQPLIDRTLAAALQHGAAVPAMPVALTIKEARGPLPAPVQRTIPRQTLWSMQTPQIIRTESLRLAFARCPIPLDQVTDDVQLIELAGGEVWLVEGEERNLKITTEMDLRMAEMMLGA